MQCICHYRHELYSFNIDVRHQLSINLLTRPVSILFYFSYQTYWVGLMMNNLGFSPETDRAFANSEILL